MAETSGRRDCALELAGGWDQMCDDRSRGRGLLEDVRAQNSRLRQLIEATSRLLARSQALLRSLRTYDVAPAKDDKRPPE